MGYRSAVQEKQLRSLESRLEAAFWNPVVTKARPLLPSRVLPSSSPARSSGIRLQPLPDSTSERGYAYPSQELQSSSRRQPGHIGAIWDLRRSKASTHCDWWLLASSQKGNLSGTSQLMAELVASAAQGDDRSCAGTPVRASKDVRVRRIRRSADYGAPCKDTGEETLRRTNSAAATVAASSNLSAVAADLGQAAPQLTRCSSVPAVGTCKADQEAVARAKAKAKVTFQRFFFEEMARGGQDANDAAARALLRLSQAPHGSAACASGLMYVDGSVQP